MRANLTVVLLLGLLAFLVNAVFGSGSDSEEETDAGRAPVAAETRPDPAEALEGTRVEWASWRDREPVEPSEDPSRDLVDRAPERDRDPRLEAVLRNLENVDVFVEGER
jgi:hypothetical protein